MADQSASQQQSSQRLQTKNIQSKDIENDDSIDPIKNRQKPTLREKQKKKKRHLLSFDDDADEHIDKVYKNPEVKQNKNQGASKSKNKGGSLQQQLKQQYLEQTEKMKQQLFELEYSYWQGGNIIKKLRRKKKQTIGQLLQFCRLQLIENFQELAKVSSKDLLFVIKDFIAPHEMALYEIQALELKTTKEDQLLNFKNIKIKKDGKQTTISVNLSQPARIIQKQKYEKNKMCYPFCNWQTLSLK